MTPGRAYQSDALRELAADPKRLSKPLGIDVRELIGLGGSGVVFSTAIPDIVAKVTVDDDECAMWTVIRSNAATDVSVRAGFPAVLRIVQLRGRDIPAKACAILREACDPLVVRRGERIEFSERTQAWIAREPGRLAELERCEHLWLAYRSTAKIVNDQRRAQARGLPEAEATARITPSGPRTALRRNPAHPTERMERLREQLDLLVDTPFRGVALAIFALMDDDAVIIADTHTGNFGWRLDRDEIVLFDPGWSPVLYYDEVETVLVPNARRVR